MTYPDVIPDKPGIYYWFYWPEYDLENITAEELLKKLKEYTHTNLRFPENFNKFKYSISVSESLLYKNEKELLGLSTKKTEELILYLKENIVNVQQFAAFFQEACFLKPFYVGKANSLNNRLRQHFNKKNDSHIIDKIELNKINFNNIWVGYKILEVSTNEIICNIYEETLQRIIKPGLTIRPG